MKTFEAIEMIKTIATNGLDLVPMLLSGPGLGKTSLVHQTVEQLTKQTGETWGLKTVHLSSYDAPDVQGFGIPTKDANGNNTMVFTRPEFWPGPDDPERGVLFFDEFGQAAIDVQKPVARIVNERQIGSFKLPPGWIVILASNREKDRSGVNRMLSMMQNRLTSITIDPSLEAWTRWAETTGINPIITAFAKFKPGLVFAESVPETPGPFTTPRTLCMSGTVLENFDNEDIATQMVMGYMGNGAGAELLAFVRMASELPDFDEIITDPEGTPVPQKPDAQFAVSQMVSHRLDETNVAQAFKYISRMPREFQVSALNSALRRNPSIAQNSQFSAWAMENHKLIMSSYA